MKKSTKIIAGVALIAVGVLYALKVLNLFDFDVFFKGWWTVFIIVPSLVGLINDRDKTGACIGLAVGVLLLLAARGILEYGIIWKLAVPLILAVIGIKLIVGGVRSNKSYVISEQMKQEGKTPRQGYAAFSGSKINYAGEVFEGAELNAVFGGIDCDLRGAVINSDCVINATAVFGGIDIFVPDNVNVKVNSNSLFGGASDKRVNRTFNNQYTLYVNATGLFGGVDVK